MVHRIRTNTDQATELVPPPARASRSAADPCAGLVISHAPIDLAYICLKRAGARHEEFAASGVGFAVHVERAPVHGDAGRLEEVVDHLLSTALRRTARGGRVELWVRAGAAVCAVEVRGPASRLRREDLPHGVRELVTAHRGRLELRAGPKAGATLRVVMPTGASTARRARRGRAASAPVPASA